MNVIESLREEIKHPTTAERKEELIKRALSALETCYSAARSISCCEDCGVINYNSCDTACCVHSLSIDVARMRANILEAIE